MTAVANVYVVVTFFCFVSESKHIFIFCVSRNNAFKLSQSVSH